MKILVNGKLSIIQSAPSAATLLRLLIARAVSDPYETPTNTLQSIARVFFTSVAVLMPHGEAD